MEWWRAVGGQVRRGSKTAGAGGPAGRGEPGLSTVQPAGGPLAGQNVAMPGGGPVVVRLLLGAQLRRLRESCGITREDAGYQIRASRSKISRLEHGRVGCKERDIADLLAFYGAPGRQRETLLTLARQANGPGWWAPYREVVAGWFESYVGLEQAAALIRTYEVQFVPGLLQTADYARAVMMLGHPDASAGQIELRVGLRLARQQLLSAPGPATLWAVVDEAALRRPLGGPQVMRAQLQHLIAISERPNMVVQILPLRCGGHAAAGGAFTILRFADPDLADVVYLEQLTSALYLGKREDTDRYMQVMDCLSAQAEPPEHTTGFLTKTIKMI